MMERKKERKLICLEEVHLTYFLHFEIFVSIDKTVTHLLQVFDVMSK